MSKKVKIVAVAKDEAAYLPEWIHHHLYIGVDAVDIYVNRTTDNTNAVLQKIVSCFPQVKVLNGDWIDTCPPEVNRYIQYVTYAHAFEQNRISQAFDYLLFIDIDEFWMPKNLDNTIQSYINKLGDPPCISVQWLNQYGDPEPFTLLSSIIEGDLVRNVKSLVHKNAQLKRMSLHHPLFHTLGQGLMVDGDVFCGSDGKVYRETLHAELSKLREVMIIHRADRSEFEYISLLFRGRPSDNIPLKLNREGMHVKNSQTTMFELDRESFVRYEDSRTRFLDKLSIENELLEAKEFVKKRAELTLQSIPQLLKFHSKELKITFSNVNHPRVIEFLGNVKRPLKLESTPKIINAAQQERDLAKSNIGSKSYLRVLSDVVDGNPDTLRDLALCTEMKVPRIAYRLMLRAKKSRPEGPLINRKLKEYRDKYGYK